LQAKPAVWPDQVEEAGGEPGRVETVHQDVSEHADDVARVGRNHLYVAWTFAWMNVATGYDMTVIPFIEKIHGNGYRELHAPGSLYEANAYPVRAVQDAGGITAARGHAGDNRGRTLVLALARGAICESAQTPVFGCALHDAPSPTPTTP